MISLGQPMLATTARRLAQGVSFGAAEEPDTMRYETSYDKGHRHSVFIPAMGGWVDAGQVRAMMRSGFGQEIPGLPGVTAELPPLPGYVTEQAHQAALAQVEEDNNSKVMMVGGVAAVLGLALGVMAGKSMRRR